MIRPNSVDKPTTILKFPYKYPRDFRNLEPPGFNEPTVIETPPAHSEVPVDGTGSDPL